ncbi:TCR/Tet family MFS transporter [Chitinophaga sp. Mgbs1]|uniref:TCR/Tet family MFS transporter n=1 Tax=Chitinophaga solisilvae TaxID=1233460 RepID=A0A3S1BJN1_9BACT|nr:TCR/Tet family MFS transporter [Chitinophaga solisilvae]
MKSSHTASLIFIVVIVTIDTAGFGLFFPVLPQLISRLIHADISTAARYGGWLAFAYAVMQFAFAALLGNLSDRYGRRPVLLCSLLGFSLDCLFMAFTNDIFWLFVGRAVAGITGASFAVASASIADISTEANRTTYFGYINAAFGLGFIIGPVIGGTLGQFGVRVPFIAASVLSFANLVFGWLFFPESLRPENRRSFEWKRANPLGALRHLRKFPLVKSLIVAVIFISIASHSMESIWAFYTIEKFRWSDQLIGYSLAFIGVLSVIVQMWLVGLLTKYISDRQMAVTGLLCMAAGFMTFAFAGRQWLLFPALLVYITGSIQGTALQSIMSSAMPDNEQGELQGSLGSLMGLTTLIAPPLMTSSFSWFTGSHAPVYFPGISFLVAGILTVVSLLLMMKSFSRKD